MKQKTIFLFGMLGVLLLSSCAGIKVTTDYDKSVDFTQFKTFEYYGWEKDSDKLLNEFDKKRIESAFSEEFKKRDMKYVKSNGDLIVTLYIITEKKTKTTATTTTIGGYGGYYGYGPRYGWSPGMRMGHSTTTLNNYNYTEGTLVVDVYDANGKRLIWESIGKETVDKDPKTRDKNIPKSVAAIMKTYPVAPIK